MSSVLDLKLEIDLSTVNRLYNFIDEDIIPLDVEDVGLKFPVPQIPQKSFPRVVQLSECFGLCQEKQFVARCAESSSKDVHGKLTKKLLSWLVGENEHVLPPYVIPVYEPGDLIKVNVIISVQGTIDSGKLMANFTGKELVYLMVPTRIGERKATDSETVMDDCVTVWQPNENLPVLSQGTHQFSVQFSIPETTKPSVLPLLQGNIKEQALLSYSVRAKFDFGDPLGRGNVDVQRGLMLRIPSKHLHQLPLLKESHWTTNDGIFTKGNIYCKVLLRNQIYSPGDILKFVLEIDNKSARDITKVVCSLIVKGRIKAGRTKQSPSKTLELKLDANNTGPVSPKSSVKRDVDLELDFQDVGIENYFVPSSDAKFRLITLDYHIIVKLLMVQSPPFEMFVPIDVKIKPCLELEEEEKEEPIMNHVDREEPIMNHVDSTDL